MDTHKYNPPAPTPGLAVINLISAEEKAGGTYITYDIGTGSSAGYAFIQYQQTGYWPLTWYISDSPQADVVYQCAIKAVQYTNSAIQSLTDVQNVSIVADLQYDRTGNIRVCRSFPLARYDIPPADIRVGTVSWANGSPDFVRASLIAKNSGLPVLLADMKEKDSPLIEWCAANRVAIQPMLFPVGDYRLPRHDTIVVREANLLELYENFVMPDKRLMYKMDAALAASHGRRLVYVTVTKAGDQVNTIKDLRNWSAQVPGRGTVADGEYLYNQLTRHQRFFPHTEFRFCEEKKLCATIYNILQN